MCYLDARYPGKLLGVQLNGMETGEWFQEGMGGHSDPTFYGDYSNATRDEYCAAAASTPPDTSRTGQRNHAAPAAWRSRSQLPSSAAAAHITHASSIEKQVRSAGTTARYKKERGSTCTTGAYTKVYVV